MRSDRRVLGALLTGAALAFAGCGGGGDEKKPESKGDYVKHVNEVGSTLEKELRTVSAALAGNQQNAKALGTELNGGAKVLASAAEDLADITPPDKVKAAHQDIVDGVRELADAFRTGAKQAGAGDLKSIEKSFAALASSAGVKDIQKGVDALKAAGYDVSG